MKPAPFEFVRPASLAEAVEVLAANPDAKVLAGGQSLVPLLSMRLAAPAMLVDINGIAELSYVRSGADGVHVGALARHSEVETDEGARRVQPLLGLALREVAHPVIRNRGTTVGSIIHADPAAEMPVVLTLLRGHVTAVSVSGRRDVAATDLYLGSMESALRHDEIAVDAFFPALSDGTGVAFEEARARRRGDYSMCGVAAQVRVVDGRPVEVRAGYVAVSDVPTVVDLTAAFDGDLSPGTLDGAGDLALAALDPSGDIHASAAYRRQLVRALTARVVTAAHAHALSRAGAGVR